MAVPRLLGCVFALIAFACAAAVEPAGGVKTAAGNIPFSDFASAAAREQFVRSMNQPSAPPAGSPVETRRRFYDDFNTRLVNEMRARYDVHVEPAVLNGVPVDVVTPSPGIAARNKKRVLINLHGGAFMWGAHSGGLVESIPIASVGGIRVISVDYREGPEHTFPAASEDVTAVYRALLKDYAPQSIGIYGCSAGGILTAQAVAWINAHQLPAPGAIGTFCGSTLDLGGDSAYSAALLTGQALPESPLGAKDLPYFKNAKLTDPLVFPGLSQATLAGFPPTLLITGSRDFAMSSVIESYERLRQAHVDAELHVLDGMWHAFFIYCALPESQAAYRLITHFFERHLRP